MSKSNVKSFPINVDTKLDNIFKEFNEVLDREFGKNTYASYVTIVHSSDLGKTEDDEAEITSYRFAVIPEGLSEDDTDVFTGLLYKAISKDTNVGSAVVHRYSQKFAEFMGHLVDGEDEEEEN